MLCSGLVGEVDGLASEMFKFGRESVEFGDKWCLYIWSMRENISNILRK